MRARHVFPLLGICTASAVRGGPPNRECCNSTDREPHADEAPGCENERNLYAEGQHSSPPRGLTQPADV
jgi:hypothetical protein